MSDKKHIDRLFQEKLKDFEATPSDKVWESIEKELHGEKRKRRILPLWWQMAGVAAVLALLFVAGNFVFNDSSKIDSTIPIVNSKDSTNASGTSSETNTVVNNEDSQSDEVNKPAEDLNSLNKSDKTSNQKINTASANTNNKVNSEIEKNGTNTNALINNSTSGPNNTASIASNAKSQDAINSSNLPELNPIAIENGQDKIANGALVDTQKNDANTIVADVQTKSTEVSEINEKISEEEPKSIEEAIAELENINEEEEKLNRWNISTNVAPVYFNAIGNGSSLDNQFVGNSKSGQVNLSYGINGSYAINKKLKIRAGVNKVDLGYNTNDVIVYKGVPVAISSAVNRTSSNINLDKSASNTSILSSQNLGFAAVPEVITSDFKSSINQELGFIELPVEIEYSVISKKFGVNVIGGFSAFFLDNNKIYTTLNRDKSLLGEANNINNTSYSANFGLGLNYDVSDKIRFNLEPTFKYQINTFRDTSGNFQPYLIGVYTGLSYKF